jgi:hypothetical protein
VEMRRILWQLACVEHVIRRVTAGWRAWVTLAAWFAKRRPPFGGDENPRRA